MNTSELTNEKNIDVLSEIEPIINAQFNEVVMEKLMKEINVSFTTLRIKNEKLFVLRILGVQPLKPHLIKRSIDILEELQMNELYQSHAVAFLQLIKKKLIETYTKLYEEYLTEFLNGELDVVSGYEELCASEMVEIIEVVVEHLQLKHIINQLTTIAKEEEIDGLCILKCKTGSRSNGLEKLSNIIYQKYQILSNDFIGDTTIGLNSMLLTNIIQNMLLEYYRLK
ncbi:hypothetical protein QTN25_007892 [Entamoeba marina]